MQDLQKDLNIIDGKGELYEIIDFAFIYPRSEEEVKELFSKINVRNKDVLSVLSSSDYLFSCLVKDVKSIDTFDINPLTLRYYYLRKWLLELGYIDINCFSYDELKEIINFHKDSNNIDEKESVMFWNYYFNKHEFKHLYDEPIFEIIDNLKIKTVYDDKIDLLNEKLKGYNLTFYNTNIIEESINKKYDIILMSNIIDYVDTNSARDTLYDLLNDNGEVVSVSMGALDLDKQMEIFSEKFEVQELFKSKRENIEDTYYKYIKK